MLRKCEDIIKVLFEICRYVNIAPKTTENTKVVKTF